MSVEIPRIIIAGTGSGTGKTSITLALTAALKRRGLRVQTFKVGPDFLDPSHLTLAAGRPCYNLDGWMCSREYVQGLFSRVAAEADLAVIEGVMGLFDGASAENLSGSTAEIAAWLQAPVILVVNTHGLAGSLAAMVAGYAGFEKSVRLAGVVANFCGSWQHADGLARTLQARPDLPPLVGAVPRGRLPQIKSRPLGLVTADPESNLTSDVLAQLADCAESCLNLDEIIRAARTAPKVISGKSLPQAAPSRVNLAVARDKAFHFYYQDLFDELSARGCTILPFSPLTDTCLPEYADGLYLGGGYPEEFAETLSVNEAMLASIRAFASSGRPVYAECGGLIYLSEAITTLEGRCLPLLGILPVQTRMLPKKKFLGYVQAELKAASLWGGPGMMLRGHEFHYSELTADPTTTAEGWRSVYRLKACRNGAEQQEGYQYGNILASYAHLHLASRPEAIEKFLQHCTNTAGQWSP